MMHAVYVQDMDNVVTSPLYFATRFFLPSITPIPGLTPLLPIALLKKFLCILLVEPTLVPGSRIGGNAFDEKLELRTGGKTCKAFLSLSCQCL